MNEDLGRWFVVAMVSGLLGCGAGLVGCGSRTPQARPDPVVQPSDPAPEDPVGMVGLPYVVFRIGARQPVSVVVYEGHQCAACEELLAQTPLKLERIAPGVTGISRVTATDRLGPGRTLSEASLRGAMVGVPVPLGFPPPPGARRGATTSPPSLGDEAAPLLWEGRNAPPEED